MNDPQKHAQQEPEQERTYLYVPFADKNEAKKLGARWDPEGRAWYVPPGVPIAPFKRWFRAPLPAEGPLHLELHTAERNHDELVYLAQVRPPVGVVLMSYECWQCHQYAPAFYGLAEGGGLLLVDALYWPDVIEQIGSFRKRKELLPFGTVKPRLSKTLGRSIVSQGCSRCDSIFGSHFLGPAALDHSLNLPESYPYQFDLDEWPPDSLRDYLQGCTR